VLILGIDPGTQVLGYGLVRKTPQGVEYVAHDSLKIAQRIDFVERLGIMSQRVEKLIQEMRPQVSVIEKIFLGKNVDSAFKLGHIRGVCVHESIKVGAEVVEYTPRLVKQGITGSGSATKEQVQMLLCSQLNIRAKANNFDASDALALAFYHAMQVDVIKRFKGTGIEI
jgi:crossover junction endodeoxyribonuclease RuvC